MSVSFHDQFSVGKSRGDGPLLEIVNLIFSTFCEHRLHLNTYVPIREKVFFDKFLETEYLY